MNIYTYLQYTNIDGFRFFLSVTNEQIEDPVSAFGWTQKYIAYNNNGSGLFIGINNSDIYACQFNFNYFGACKYRNKNGSTEWSDWKNYLTNSDLQKLHPHAANTSFKEYLSRYLSNGSYIIFPFANISDNPFSFSSGACIACLSGLLGTHARAIAFDGTSMETKIILIR